MKKEEKKKAFSADELIPSLRSQTDKTGSYTGVPVPDGLEEPEQDADDL